MTEDDWYSTPCGSNPLGTYGAVCIGIQSVLSLNGFTIAHASSQAFENTTTSATTPPADDKGDACEAGYTLSPGAASLPAAKCYVLVGALSQGTYEYTGGAYAALGLTAPITDWHAAWTTIQSQIVEAMDALRVEVLAAVDAGDQEDTNADGDVQ